jgi:hypothetical protein
LESAQGLPFGATLKKIMNTGFFDASLETRFRKILRERNWLVHKSCGTNRNAPFSDPAMDKVVRRDDAMPEEARSLLQVFGLKVEGYAREQAVSMKDVDERANTLLAQWHASGEPS